MADFIFHASMQNTRLLHASRILLAPAALGLLLLSGCSTTLTNLTPDSLPANPSQLYTLSVRFNPHAATLVPGSVSLEVIVDGQPHPMTKSPAGQDIYTYDFPAPAGIAEIRYYVLASYSARDRKGQVIKYTDHSELHHAKVSGRYVITLGTNRGPVGARIGVVGSGFTAQDKIFLGTTPAQTVVESPNALGFFVPAVENGRNYDVKIVNATGTTIAGTFHVDASTVTVTPSALTLRAGETQLITFAIPTVAPAGGTLLDVTTDVPNSVIMPEVIVPGGFSDVTVRVTGTNTPGSGSLFLKGYGPGEIAVPVTVTK
jgi:hypothetical protein